MQEKQPGRALQLRGEHLPARIDRAKTTAVIERAKAALDRRALSNASPGSPPVEIVFAPMTCSTFGTPFLAIIERRHDSLVIVGHRAAPQGAAAAPHAPLYGHYRVTTAPGWACPCCNYAGDMIWICRCKAYFAAIHCGGTADGKPDGLRWCASKKLEHRALVTSEFVQVAGRSLGVSSS